MVLQIHSAERVLGLPSSPPRVATANIIDSPLFGNGFTCNSVNLPNNLMR